MKVRELVEKLSAMNPGHKVICYTEDQALLPSGQLLRVLEIEAVSQLDAERTRLDDGTPYLRLGKGAGSEQLVVLEVTSET